MQIFSTIQKATSFIEARLAEEKAQTIRAKAIAKEWTKQSEKELEKLSKACDAGMASEYRGTNKAGQEAQRLFSDVYSKLDDLQMELQKLGSFDEPNLGEDPYGDESTWDKKQLEELKLASKTLSVMVKQVEKAQGLATKAKLFEKEADAKEKAEAKKRAAEEKKAAKAAAKKKAEQQADDVASDAHSKHEPNKYERIPRSEFRPPVITPPEDAHTDVPESGLPG